MIGSAEGDKAESGSGGRTDFVFEVAGGEVARKSESRYLGSSRRSLKAFPPTLTKRPVFGDTMRDIFYIYFKIFFLYVKKYFCEEIN
jgi:hypothetical protein